MKNVCCADCRYAYYNRIYKGTLDWKDDYYCTAGSVLIAIADPYEAHDCGDYWPIS